MRRCGSRSRPASLTPDDARPAIDGVEEVTGDEVSTVIVDPRPGRRCSPRWPRPMRSAGLQVSGATLEDVFLALTGREYRA